MQVNIYKIWIHNKLDRNPSPHWESNFPKGKQTVTESPERLQIIIYYAEYCGLGGTRGGGVWPLGKKLQRGKKNRWKLHTKRGKRGLKNASFWVINSKIYCGALPTPSPPPYRLALARYDAIFPFSLHLICNKQPSPTSLVFCLLCNPAI